MFYVAQMYTDRQWVFDTFKDVKAFLWTDEVHHNDAIVVEVRKDGARAWIGTDFLQRYDEILSFA